MAFRTSMRAAARRPKLGVWDAGRLGDVGHAVAPAATPRALWARLQSAGTDGAVDPRAFTLRTIGHRLREVGDLWAPVHGARGVDLGALAASVGVSRAGSRGARRGTAAATRSRGRSWPAVR